MGQQTLQVAVMVVLLIALTIQLTPVVQIVLQAVLKVARQNAITIARRRVSTTAMDVAMIRVAADAHTLVQAQGVQDVLRHVH